MNIFRTAGEEWLVTVADKEHYIPEVGEVLHMHYYNMNTMYTRSHSLIYSEETRAATARNISTMPVFSES